MECKEPVNLESLQRDGKDTPNSWRYSVVNKGYPVPEVTSPIATER
jgi:hypothetical protein